MDINSILLNHGVNKRKTMPATSITEDSTHRFVTDTDKTNWNAKETTSGAQSKANSAETNAKNFVMGYGIGSVAKAVPSGNWNSAVEGGIYTYNNASNQPPSLLGASNTFMGIVMQLNTKQVIQLVFDLNNVGMWSRYSYDSAGTQTWASWKQMNGGFSNVDDEIKSIMYGGIL